MKQQNPIHLTPLLAQALLFCFLLSHFCFTPSAFAQAPGYSREEVAAGENANTGPGMPPPTRSSLVGNSMSMPGARSIGARGAQMGGGVSGGPAVLRYDHHRDIQPRDDATLRIGPLYSDVGILQSVGYRYVRLEGSGVDFVTANRRGDISEDGTEFPVVSSVTLNNYLIISRHMDLEADVKVSYMHYPMNTQADELRVDLADGGGVSGTFSSELHPTRNSRLLIYDDIDYRTDYLDSRGRSDRYGGEAYEYLENTVGADWDWKPSPFDNVSLSASREDTIPMDNTFTNQEGVAYSEAVSYQRLLTRFSSAGFVGSLSQSLYELESRSDIFMSGISVFAAARLTRRLTSNVSLGYQTSTYKGGTSDGNRSGSMFWGGELAHEISEEKSQKLTYRRTQAEAFNGGVNITDQTEYMFSWSGGLFPGEFNTGFSASKPEEDTRNGYSDWTTGLTLQHQLTRLLELTLTGRYAIRKNDSSDTATDTTTPDLNSDYETLSVRLGTGMALTRKTRFETYVEHAERTSENENLAYSRDIFSATVTWSHQF